MAGPIPLKTKILNAKHGGALFRVLRRILSKRPNRKPGSVLNDDLSRLHVAMQLQPPPGARRARIAPIWALLLVGFTEPRKSPSALVRSYRTFPPFPVRGTGSLFLLHYPWGHPRLPLAVTIPLWSPDFPQSAKAPRRRMFCSFGQIIITWFSLFWQEKSGGNAFYAMLFADWPRHILPFSGAGLRIFSRDGPCLRVKGRVFQCGGCVFKPDMCFFKKMSALEEQKTQKIDKRKHPAKKLLAYPTKFAALRRNSLIFADGHLKNTIKW